jgi:hypothetical protein
MDAEDRRLVRRQLAGMSHFLESQVDQYTPANFKVSPDV